jgi:hypothetical protein
MDLTEFKDYLAEQLSQDFDLDGFDDYWDDLTKENVY